MDSSEGHPVDINGLEAAWRQAYALLETRLATLEQADAQMRARLAALEASRPAHQHETRNGDLAAVWNIGQPAVRDDAARIEIGAKE